MFGVRREVHAGQLGSGRVQGRAVVGVYRVGAAALAFMHDGPLDMAMPGPWGPGSRRGNGQLLRVAFGLGVLTSESFGAVVVALGLGALLVAGVGFFVLDELPLEDRPVVELVGRTGT